jgi:hypothetical protein
VRDLWHVMDLVCEVSRSLQSCENTSHDVIATEVLSLTLPQPWTTASPVAKFGPVFTSIDYVRTWNDGPRPETAWKIGHRMNRNGQTILLPTHTHRL